MNVHVVCKFCGTGIESRRENVAQGRDLKTVVASQQNMRETEAKKDHLKSNLI